MTQSRRNRERGPIERGIARVLVITMLATTPGIGFADDGFDSVDDAVMLTPGRIEDNDDGYTTIYSDVDNGVTDWQGGFNQPAGHVLEFDLAIDGATHTNLIGGDEAGHINGTILSGPNDTIVFASPHGIFIGSTAIINVGNLVAAGADLTVMEQPVVGDASLELTGDVVNQGIITASQDVLLYGTSVVNTGEIYTEAGRLLMLGADSIHFMSAESIAEGLVNPVDFVALLGDSTVVNMGTIQAEEAALIGRRVLNTGHIEIDDGSLMMIGGDAVYLRSFDDPVVIKLPNATEEPANYVDANGTHQFYAVENRGTINAGRGRVRLAAADPLGWGIRQQTTDDANPASIIAQDIEISGGENGRVELGGIVDASDRSAGGVGGEIEITGETIVLAGATIDASGDLGGGTIHIGGEQQGRGELQRARALIMDEASSVRADAITNGDGGRVILFSEFLTSIDGDLSARGGEEGGNGGFIETSGLQNFRITKTPDASAPAGLGGEWLIDPYDINIVADLKNAACVAGAACLANAVEAILRPNFDSAGFDDILRTVDPTLAGPGDIPSTILLANEVEADLLVRALSVGINVTLSTEAILTNDESVPEAGNINVNADILIPEGGAAPGTRATLSLRAANDININNDILVGDGDLTSTPDMALSLELRANDVAQTNTANGFEDSDIQGSVNIDANIRTGGGNFLATGISVNQSSGVRLDTDGGNVRIFTGSVDRFDEPTTLSRNTSEILASVNSGISIEGTIDTSRPADDQVPGGTIDLDANAVGISSTAPGAPLFIDTAELFVGGNLISGGGEVTLTAGIQGTPNTGNVRMDGASINSSGPEDWIPGASVTITANGLDDESALVSTPPDYATGGVTPIRGGDIDITASSIVTRGGDLLIGGAFTQRISMDGTFNTIGGFGNEDGLMSIVAIDESAVNSTTNPFGNGLIEIGANGTADLQAAGISILARDVLFSDGTSPNAVTIQTSGDSTSERLNTTLGLTGDRGEDPIATVGTVSIEGERLITFHENTQITARTIDIVAAVDPSRTSEAERSGADALTRLRFEGTGGANAADGVRLNGDTISISVGDGTTPSDGLAFVATDDMGTPTEFGVTRETTGSYEGLQLRDQMGTTGRPQDLTIRQDGDLTVDTTGGLGRVFLGARSGAASTGGAFDDAVIGALGQRVTLESSDGVLTIEDAAGLSSATSVTAGDPSGRSWVTLNGGLLLPTTNVATDGGRNSVAFLLGDPGDVLFDAESITITTPRDFNIDSTIASGISSTNELIFQAGRDVDTLASERGGNLTVDAGLTLAARDRLLLHAGASGFGNLAFVSGATTELRSNGIELRAGGGAASESDGLSGRPQVIGAALVDYRDAAGGDFQSDAAIQKSFSLRQDAAIDAATHLPTLANFGIDAGMSETFGATGLAVKYSLRSDFGTIDLSTGGFDAAQVRDSSISLIASQEAGTPFVLPGGFIFDGANVTLGGVGNFTLTQALADAFDLGGIASAATQLVTLNAGLNQAGTLNFESGVTVRAPRIALVVGDGSGGTTGSSISTAGAMFDLQDGAANDRRFTFQQDADFALSNLPSRDQFVGGILPSILALRSDGGTLVLDDPDFTDIALELTDGANAGRLILEADELTLRASGGNDLELTSSADSARNALLANLRLRLRSDVILLETRDGSETNAGAVLAGRRVGDAAGQIPTGTDSAFDGQSLLIEGFTDDQTATTDNLSALSADPENDGQFELADGRGPTSIIVSQDADITSAELFNNFHVSGELARSTEDDDEGVPNPTQLRFISNFGDVAFNADNVSGSQLDIGFATFAEDFDVTFESGAGAFDFDSVFIFTEGDITLQSNADITAQDTIQLEAGMQTFQLGTTITAAAEDRMGRLVFEGAGTTDLSANTTILRAGPGFVVTNPDSDGDGVREDIESCNPTTCTPSETYAGLAYIDFAGLGTLSITDDQMSSSLTVNQSADLTTTDVTLALAGAGAWDTVDFASIQGTTRVTNLSELAPRSRNVSFGRANDAMGQLVIEENGATPALFSAAAGFDGQVRLESNDILFEVNGVSDIQLDSPNLRFVSEDMTTGLETAADLGRVDSDPDSIDRARIGIVQSGDYSTTLLPRADRFFQVRQISFSDFGTFRAESRDEFQFDLTTTGSEFIFDDDIRDGVQDANVSILATDPGADFIFRLSDLAPGVRDYEFTQTEDLAAIDFPIIEVTSIEVQGFDTIRVEPFTPTLPGGGGSGRQELTIASTGDQVWNADFILEETFRTQGRDILFGDNVYRDTGAPTDAGLIIETRGLVTFNGNIGINGDAPATPAPTAEQLGKLWVLFDNDVVDRTPAVQFADTTGPTTDQAVVVDGDIVFLTTALNDPDDPNDSTDGNRIRDLLANAGDEAIAEAEIGRENLSPFATIGKLSGDLTFLSASGGDFVMGSGERLAVGGTARIDHAGATAILGDVAALDIEVNATEISLVRRNAGVTTFRDGSTTQDGGGLILANTIDFGGVDPTSIGIGEKTRFAVPDPFAATNPAFLAGFSVSALRPNDGLLSAEDFRFVSGPVDQVAFPLASGASRSELTGAFGPEVVPIWTPDPVEPAPLADPALYPKIGVTPRETPAEVQLARLEGGAIIDDLGVVLAGRNVAVTEARLDAGDAASAIELYESLFGSDGTRQAEVRQVLQDALDRYLEATRARRVIGFELRRFVKNRPSTLLDAYTALDELDQLFRYHRRLGLSPGEFRSIQAEWLAQIQPEGITLDEFSEAIHPSRYVRGSDILDIFGR